jgi:hypothetical protein
MKVAKTLALWTFIVAYLPIIVLAAAFVAYILGSVFSADLPGARFEAYCIIWIICFIILTAKGFQVAKRKVIELYSVALPNNSISNLPAPIVPDLGKRPREFYRLRWEIPVLFVISSICVQIDLWWIVPFYFNYAGFPSWGERYAHFGVDMYTPISDLYYFIAGGHWPSAAELFLSETMGIAIYSILPVLIYIIIRIIVSRIKTNPKASDGV